MNNNLEGSGIGSLFGGGSSNAKTEPSDTARSVSYGQVIELLCSGGNNGIQGFIPDLPGGVYVNETPISSNGIDNVKGVLLSARLGEPFSTPT